MNREKIMENMNIAKAVLCNPNIVTPEMCIKIGQTISAAIALLRMQEPMPMLEVEDDDLYAWSPEDVSYYCPRPECGKEISYDYNFCPYCGQAVKLNEIN